MGTQTTLMRTDRLMILHRENNNKYQILNMEDFMDIIPSPWDEAGGLEDMKEFYNTNNVKIIERFCPKCKSRLIYLGTYKGGTCGVPEGKVGTFWTCERNSVFKEEQKCTFEIQTREQFNKIHLIKE